MSQTPDPRPRFASRPALAAATALVLALTLLAGAVNANLLTSPETTPTSWDQPLADSVAIAKLATRWQAESLGMVMPDSFPMPQHATPSAAALALAQRHGVTPDTAQMQALLALDVLPADKAASLTAVIDAFLSTEDATKLVYEHVDMAVLQSLVEHGTTRDASSESAFGLDFSPIFAAHNNLLDASLIFSQQWPGAAASQSMSSSPPGINMCPAFAFDLVGIDTNYPDDCAFIVDVGGNDLYTNNAGGGSGSLDPDCGFPARPNAALIDLLGDDQYTSGGYCGRNGGGYAGNGFLLDVLGNDIYTANWGGVNGGAEAGRGFLLDNSGDDYYSGGWYGVNGGGHNGGAGFLFDNSGNDAYSAGTFGVNGGSSGLSHGFLLDAQGTDQYQDADGGTGTDKTVVPKGIAGAQIDTVLNPCPESVDPGTLAACGQPPVCPSGITSPPGPGELAVACGIPVLDPCPTPVGTPSPGQLVVVCGQPVLDPRTLAVVKTRENPDGTITLYNDQNGNDNVDSGETITTLDFSPADTDRDGVADTLENQICSRAATRDQVNAHPESGHCDAAPTFDYTPPTGSEWTVFIPTNAVAGVDADQDGFPSSVTLTGIALTAAPFTGGRATAAPTQQVVTVDSADNDPNVPAGSQFGPVSVPVAVTPGPDADDDGVPLNAVIAWNDVSIDRTQAMPIIVTQRTTTQALDTDDADPNVPAQSQACSEPFPTGVSPGADADDDGVPVNAVVTWSIVCVDRTQAMPVSVTVDHTSTVDLDSNDADPNVPAQSQACSEPFPTGVSPGADADDDGVPVNAVVTWSIVCVDRTQAMPVSVTVDHTSTVDLDSNDNNPNVPVQSQFGPVSAPVSVVPSADADQDGLPASVTITWTDINVDRTQAMPVTLASHTTVHVVDPDDNDPDDPVPFSLVDADGDRVPDAAEPLVCDVQSESDPMDGKCVQPDGSGVDGSGDNYVRPF